MKKVIIVTIAFGIVASAVSGRHAFVRIHPVMTYHHQIFMRISQSYESLIQTYLRAVMKNWLRT